MYKTITCRNLTVNKTIVTVIETISKVFFQFGLWINRKKAIFLKFVSCTNRTDKNYSEISFLNVEDCTGHEYNHFYVVIPAPAAVMTVRGCSISPCACYDST